MTLEELFRYLSQAQQSPNYAPNQVAGQGILGQGLQSQRAQIEQQTGGAPVPAPAPTGGLLGGGQTMSPPPAPGAGAASKEAIIAQVLASGDKTRIAQLKHMGWI
jgi:hypothetical protein